ncbi:MAG TPA: VOC family protein [Candidatus Sulfotelmatobacter sp.]|nr:VOC family protein [Candidatus Sulfotelmatobacter sp.]
MNESTRASASICGIDLAGLIVKDVPAEIAFYRDVLGIAPTAVDDEGRGAEFTLADGTTFGVWNPGEDGELQPGLVIFFAVNDARAAIDAIRARGGAIGDPFESPVCVMGWGSDPDGNGFCVHQRKNRADDAPAPAAGTDPADVIGTDLTGFVASDVPRSIAFYRDVLGLTPTQVYADDHGAEFTLADGSTFGVYNPGGSVELPPAGAGMLAVRDARAAAARARSRGAKVMDPQASPVCLMAFGTDAAGFGICLHQRTASD